MEEEYEPYGKDWRLEMMKFNKGPNLLILLEKSI